MEVKAVTPSKAAEFNCWYAKDRQEALGKGRYIYEKFGTYLAKDRRVVDLGCGEGAFLLWLQQIGFEHVIGVESSDELFNIARSFGVPVIQGDMLEFLRTSGREPATYMYLDVIEHVPYDVNIELLSLIPVESRVIIQTPNTGSILGHEFYMNVPSHMTPYSPWVIRRMLERVGYVVVTNGTVDGNRGTTWENRIRSYFIRKILGVDPDIILGGGNYYVVADRLR